MIRDGLPILSKPFPCHVPPRIVLRSALVDLLVQVNRPRQASDFVPRVKAITTELHRSSNTSNRRDGGRVPECLPDGRCEKRQVRC